ncbi:hypothetical protein B0H16DRAFT_1901943 [Mycena metata]|uniref:Uncharacterized protein n=1 Tax=Mycena metata TaxID=1033252 RepID=A0AAD7M7Y9_9AGAR|nr:hypothetical protein B0H16DRAFT_1901943 [Mycena metata]
MARDWFRGRFHFSPRVQLKPPGARSTKTSHVNTFSDAMWTSLWALKESSDAFPPLKSATGGVVALWEITERAKYSRTDALDIALRTKEILDVIADSVPDGATIPPPMLKSIKAFTVILGEVRCNLEDIALTAWHSRVVHLRRNERTVQEMKAQLDDVYRDFLMSSALRVEAQQAKIAVQQAKQQTRTRLDISAATGRLSSDLSVLLFYSRFAVFLASP